MLKFQPNTNEDAQDSSSSTVKKSGSSFCSSTEPVFKRARIETPSPLPTFKVRTTTQPKLSDDPSSFSCSLTKLFLVSLIESLNRYVYE